MVDGLRSFFFAFVAHEITRFILGDDLGMIPGGSIRGPPPVARPWRAHRVPGLGQL
jgi:hypothetical protein